VKTRGQVYPVHNQAKSTLGLVAFEQIDRALPQLAVASQGILLIWPQLVGMTAIVVVVFAGA